MNCFRCSSGNAEDQKFCGNCGAPLHLNEFLQEAIQASLKDRLRDQKVVESEIAETVANRLIGWGKILGVLIGIPLGILTVVLSFNLRDLSKIAEKARTEVGSEITAATDQAKKLKTETQALQQQVDEAKPQLEHLGAIQADVNNKLGVLQKNVEQELARINTKVDKVEEKIGCADDLSSCPARGCADEGSPLALANELKRNTRSVSPVRPLTFADLKSLQNQADQLVGQRKELTQLERAKLKNLTTAQGRISEGDSVRLVGYLVGRVLREGRESVNCQLLAADATDIHFTLALGPTDTEFGGIVAELIPQGRHPGWTIPKMIKVLQASRQVMVTGQLFYDNMHRVNSDPQKRTPDPARFALWEVHPVMSFAVCLRDKCDSNVASEWTPVENAP